jgi:hypothetical protein
MREVGREKPPASLKRPVNYANAVYLPRGESGHRLLPQGPGCSSGAAGQGKAELPALISVDAPEGMVAKGPVRTEVSLASRSAQGPLLLDPYRSRRAAR